MLSPFRQIKSRVFHSPRGFSASFLKLAFSTRLRRAGNIRQRAQLVKGLEARIAALPPESRDKVVHSLKAISDSKRELEAVISTLSAV